MKLIMKRLVRWLRRLIAGAPAVSELPAGRPEPAAESARDDLARAVEALAQLRREAERERQRLEAEVASREQLITTLRQEIGRQRRNESGLVEEVWREHVERLLTDAAAPASQLLTQAHLSEVEGKPVRERDVLSVAKRLVRALENHGLKLEGEVGQVVAFDPDRYAPLNPDVSPEPGERVVVRFLGASFGGKVIRKAVVTSARQGGV